MNKNYPAIKIGDKFERLTVIRRAADPQKWTCLCTCGIEKDILDRALKPAHTRSCGCLHRERAIRLGKSRRTHGHSLKPNGKQRLTPEYRAWRSMRQRCYKPIAKSYPNYGGRGIKVCKRWLNSFENFFADMGKKPTPSHTIERKNNDKGYSPSNCIWATRTEQAHNKRNNVFLVINGQRKCVSEWAQISDLQTTTLQRRVKANWPIEKILQPARRLTRRTLNAVSV